MGWRCNGGELCCRGGSAQNRRATGGDCNSAGQGIEAVWKENFVRDESKKTLKGMVKALLGQLLGRLSLSGSMDRDNVNRAIDDWLPKHGAVASALRLSP